MRTTNDFLPYGHQTIDDDDVAAVAAALKSDFLTTGPLVEQFEAVFAQATGADNVVACNSGTAALHLALLALGVRPGDAVVVPSITFLATANVVRMTGAEVVLADVDPNTGLLTSETFEAAILSADAKGLDVRAAMPVHLNGQVCDMAALSAIAGRRSIQLIEDACHALGEKDIGAATYSAAACFSTHAVKAIATGEGGMIASKNSGFAKQMRRFRNHGIVREPADFANPELAFDGNLPNPWYHEMESIGWNYRIPDILCALGIAQLKKLDRFIAARRRLAALYDQLLAPLAPAIQPVPNENRLHGWHLYVILVDFAALGTTRARFIRALHDDGIGTQVHYIPLHFQPYYRRRYGKMDLKGAEQYYARCLSIPLFPAMTDRDAHRVIDALKRLTRG